MVSWCHKHITTPLCLNMIFVMDNIWLGQMSNKRKPLWFRLGKPFLPVTSLQVTQSLPKWVLTLPSRTMEYPHGSHHYQYSELLFGALAQTKVRTCSLTRMHKELSVLSIKVKPQYAGSKHGGYTTPWLLPLNLGHSKVEQTLLSPTNRFQGPSCELR